MITLKSHGKKVIDIDEISLEKILNIYPDEHLLDRPIFAVARETGELSYSDLKTECDKLLMPWQLFLLNSARLDKELRAIDEKRKSKFDQKLIASRDNEGGGVSLRIADRLIALQEHACENVIDDNEFPGLLKGLHRDRWREVLLAYFDIDEARLMGGKKDATLNYLIDCVETKNIRVARGVLTHKLLPASNALRSTYRKSSGFVVRDEKIPYIFLPSEISDNETPGRQILTLLTLVLLIGLDHYSVCVTGEFEVRIRNNKVLSQIYGVVSEILLPLSETQKYNGVLITDEIRDDLASRFMLTPSAVIVTLRQRGHIDDDVRYRALLDGVIGGNPGDSGVKRSPKLDTAVKKLCGKRTNDEIIHGLRSGALGGVRAQYLIFGRIDKLKFETYKANVGL